MISSTRGASTFGQRVVVAAGAVATGPAVWWTVDRLNDADDPIPDPDRLIEPLYLGQTTTYIVGVGSIVLAVLGAMALSAMVRSGRWQLAAVGLAASAAAASSYAGFTYSVATTPVIGANIGAGLLILGAVPAGACLVLCATISIVRLRRPTTRT